MLSWSWKGGISFPLAPSSPMTLILNFIQRAYCCCSVPKSYLTLGSPMDHSPPGSFVHGVLQAGVLGVVVVVVV